MKKVAVVILNWNGAKFLQDFLPAVIKYSQHEDTEIIVTDNASVDNSLAMLQQHFPSVRIITNTTNEGFARGYNVALQQVHARYYVLLNSDVEVTPQWIAPVIAMMERDDTIGAAQPKIRSWHEPARFEYAGAAGGFIDKYGYPFCRGRIFQHVEEDLRQYDDEKEIFWATGACMFVRAGVFHEAGGFDEDFFAHMEEIDFCWRIKQKGYKVMYTPQSTVYHVGGGTLPAASSYKVYLNIRNNLSMLYKNLPQKSLKRILLIRLFLDGIAALKFFAGGGFRDLLAVVRAHKHFFKMIPRLKKKRRALLPGKVTKVYCGNMVAAHYLFRKKTFKALSPKRFT